MISILEMINEEVKLMTYNSALHSANTFGEDVLDFEAGNNGWWRVRVQHVATDEYDVWLEKMEWRFSKTHRHGRVFIGVTGEQVYGIVDSIFHRG